VLLVVALALRRLVVPTQAAARGATAAVVERDRGFHMGADGIGNRHLDLVVHLGWPEISDVEVHAGPGGIRALHDLDGVIREIVNPAVILYLQDVTADDSIFCSAL